MPQLGGTRRHRDDRTTREAKGERMQAEAAKETTGVEIFTAGLENKPFDEAREVSPAGMTPVSAPSVTTIFVFSQPELHNPHTSIIAARTS